MKKLKALNLVMATALLAASLPTLIAQTEESNGLSLGSARLTATRGRVEVQSPDGHWEQLKGSVPLAMGRAVRTGPNAEAVATFNDGSTVKLADESAIKVAQLTNAPDGQHLTVKVLGDVAANFSPQTVASSVVGLEFPMGRATIGKTVAMGRAVRPELAGAMAQVRIVTVTGADVRLGVTGGVVAMQHSYNVQGNVVAVDPGSNSFTLYDSSALKNRRIIVNPATQVAAVGAPAPSQNVAGMLASLSGQQNITVYGVPAAVEGPGDDGPAPASVNATAIYPQNADTFNPEGFLSAPPLPAVDSGPVLEEGDAVQYSTRGIGVVKFGFGHNSNQASQHARTWPNW